MERKISMPLYVTAFLLSAAIFAIGVYIGMLIDGYNLESISQRVGQLSQRQASVQTLLMLEGGSSDFCPVFRSELEAMEAERENLGYELSYMEEKKQAYDPELKRQYFMLEAGSYALSSRMAEQCGYEDRLLLYFYSNKGCDSCAQQGEEILRFRDRLRQAGVGMKIYSFDGEIGSPVAEALMGRYNITEYPSVVMDGATHGGYADADALNALAGRQ